MHELSLEALFGLTGRVAFVPGGYGDIGTAIARGLALAGARVAVAGRSLDKAEALAATLRDEGHDALGLAMDAHRVDDIRQAVDTVAAHFGRLDLLVNCVSTPSARRPSTSCCRST
jgi:NAD(P)-dependent dehydrogenase (short-subunit alcohol dehydrogenase family)